MDIAVKIKNQEDKIDKLINSIENIYKYVCIFDKYFIRKKLIKLYNEIILLEQLENTRHNILEFSDIETCNFINKSANYSIILMRLSDRMQALDNLL